jgi:acyl-CoA synthetase (AMP-forming)/AMP-acid ligase II
MTIELFLVCFPFITVSEILMDILSFVLTSLVTGVVKMLILSIVINAEVVILPDFTMKGLLDTITEYQIAEVQMVPPLIIRLVRDPLVDQYDLSCIKRFASGAAPISAEVLRLLEKKFPGRGFKQGYGMTESTGCITTHPMDKHAFRYARTGGTLVANTLVKVVDENGKVVGVGEKGEVCSQMIFYLRTLGLTT